MGPGWQGDLPKDVKRIDSPTPWVLLQPRVHIYKDGKVDLQGARKILREIRTTALSKYKGKESEKISNYEFIPVDLDPNLPVSALAFKDPMQFWEILAAALNENPPAQDQITAVPKNVLKRIYFVSLSD